MSYLSPTAVDNDEPVTLDNDNTSKGLMDADNDSDMLGK